MTPVDHNDARRRPRRRSARPHDPDLKPKTLKTTPHTSLQVSQPGRVRAPAGAIRPAWMSRCAPPSS
eukprot:903111-Prorocentrum_minimum.AAC.1